MDYLSVFASEAMYDADDDEVDEVRACVHTCV